MRNDLIILIISVIIVSTAYIIRFIFKSKKKDKPQIESAPPKPEKVYPSLSVLSELPYNFENINNFRENFYSIEGNNRIIAREHIIRLNTFLEEARYLVDKFPNFKINDVRFNKEDDEFNNFSFFVLEQLTDTGRLKKFPLYIPFNTEKREKTGEHFNYDENALREYWKKREYIFGRIHYFQNGEVGKVWIVCWKGHNCYVINCSLKNEVLIISSIYQNDNGIKNILYKIQK